MQGSKTLALKRKGKYRPYAQLGMPPVQLVHGAARKGTMGRTTMRRASHLSLTLMSSSRWCVFSSTCKALHNKLQGSKGWFDRSSDI